MVIVGCVHFDSSLVSIHFESNIQHENLQYMT
jgi:hypothetical protein